MYYPLQGILFSTPECIRTPIDFVKLWLHEANRVYGDKLIEIKDMDNFQKIKIEISRAGFEVSIEVSISLMKEVVIIICLALIPMSSSSEDFNQSLVYSKY